MLDDEARVLDTTLAAHALEVALPALAVGRIAEHEVELARGEGVVGERRMLRPADDVVRRVAFALEQQVGLADGVGLGVDLLAVEVGGDLLAVLARQRLQRFLGHGEHAAGAERTVVEQVGARFDLVGDRQEDELRHELDGVARRPVLAGFLVVLLVEAAHQLLEHGAHAVVVEAGGAEIDVGRGELLDQRAERVGLRQARDLVAELEVLEDVLHVRREAVEVGFEVGLELLLARARPEVAQREPGGVVERLAGGLAQGSVLVGDAGLVERGLHVEHVLLGGLEHGVETAQHGHGQDDVAILAAHVQVAQDIVGDAPDEVGDPVELSLFHITPRVGASLVARAVFRFATTYFLANRHLLPSSCELTPLYKRQTARLAKSALHRLYQAIRITP